MKQVEISPVGIWSGELSNEVCDKIIEQGLLLAQEQATISTKSDPNDIDTKIRDGKVAWFEKTSWVDRLLFYYVHKTNEQEWQFNLNGSEKAQFTVYEKNDFYTWHRDNNIESNITRKVSVTVQLSDPSEYSGGDLKLKDCWGTHEIPTVNARGTIIIFPSFLLHEVSPVNEGTRYSLVQWYSGPPFT